MMPVTIPYVYVDNRIVIQCTVDGQGPFSFIVDTGDPGIDVTPETAKRLGLTVRDAGTVTGAGNKTVHYGATKLTSIALGAAALSNVDAGVIDLTQIREKFQFAHLDGIVGRPLFEHYVTLVDVDAQTLSLSRDLPAVPANAVTTHFTGTIPVVPATIAGISTSVVVDTGDRSSLTLFGPFATSHAFFGRYPSRTNVVTGYGLGGPVYADVFTLPSIGVFGASLTDVVTRASRQTGGVFATNTVQGGSIGTGVLKRFDVVYDYANETIVAWPSKDFHAADAFVPIPGDAPAPRVHDRWPAFSPDGQLVAFERSIGTTMEIYVIPTAGGEPKKVTSTAQGTLSMAPSWLPDGRLLYTTTSVSADYPDGSLHETSIQGTDDRIAGPAAARERGVAPDGKDLLFVTRQWEVAKLDLASGSVEVVSHPPAGTWDTEAAWSPDGTKIAFGCNYVPKAKTQQSDICIMNADGSDRRVLVHRTDASEWVTWSPDGRSVAFQADRNDFAEGSIVVADVATGDAREITSNTGDALNETPNWSPNGDWIAFQVKTAEGYRIALIHPDGSGFRLLT